MSEGNSIYSVKYHNPFLAWGVLGMFTLWILPTYWAISPKHTFSKKKQKENVEAITCPYCGSKNIQFIGEGGKKVSLSKAVAGNLVFGAGGALLGLNGQKRTTRFICGKCGKPFEKKLA